MFAKPVAAGTILAAALAAPAEADADLWKGETAQGRTVSVRTAADGTVNRVRIRWKARCQGATRTGKTVFVPPLDSAGTRSFADGGTSRSRLGGGVRSRDTVSVKGRLGDRGRWRGTFRLRSVLRRSGEVVDRCRVGRIRWRARPAGTGARAAAAGKLWRGRTRQGKRVSVRTGADGLVTRVRIRWRARCSNGSKLKGATAFVRPFDQATTRSFLDEGSYRAPVDGPGTFVDTVHIRANLARNGPWRGVFKVRSEFRRNGEVLGTCRLRGVRWKARRVR